MGERQRQNPKRRLAEGILTMGLQGTPIVFGGMNDTAHPELLPENQTVFMRDLYTSGGVAKLTPRKFCLSLPEGISNHKVRWFTIWDRGGSRVVLFIDDNTGQLYSFLWEQQEKAKNIKNCSPVHLHNNTPVICDNLGTKITTAKSEDQIWIFGAKNINGILCPIKYDGNRASFETGAVSKQGEGENEKEGATTGVFFEERLVLASFLNSNRLYWTDPNDFSQIPADNWLDVYPYDNDNITGLLVYAGSIIVFKNNHIYRVIGIPPADVRIVSSRRGCPTGDGVVFNNLVYFKDDAGHLAVTDGGDEHIRDVSRGVLDNSLITKGLPATTCKPMLKEKRVSLFGCQWTNTGTIKPITKDTVERKVGSPRSYYQGQINTVDASGEFLLELAKRDGAPEDKYCYANCSLKSFSIYLKNPHLNWQPKVRAKLITGRNFKEYFDRLGQDDEMFLFRDIPGVESPDVITLDRGGDKLCTFTFPYPHAPMPESKLDEDADGNIIPHAIVLSTYDPETKRGRATFTFSTNSALVTIPPPGSPSVKVWGWSYRITKRFFQTVGWVCSEVSGNTTTHINTIEAVPYEPSPNYETIEWIVELPAQELLNCLFAKRGKIVFICLPETLNELGLEVRVYQAVSGIPPVQTITQNPCDFGIIPHFFPTKIIFRIMITSRDKRAYVGWECRSVECWIVEGDREVYTVTSNIHATPTGLFVTNTDPDTKTSELIRFDPNAGFAKITTGRLQDPTKETAMSCPMVKLVNTVKDLVVYVPTAPQSGRAFVFFSDLDKTTQELAQKYRFEPFLEPQPMAISRQTPLTTLRHHHALPRRLILRFSDFEPPPYSIYVTPEVIMDANTKTKLETFTLNAPQKIIGMNPQLTRSFGVKLHFSNISTPSPPYNLVILPAVVEWDAIGLTSKDDASIHPEA